MSRQNLFGQDAYDLRVVGGLQLQSVFRTISAQLALDRDEPPVQVIDPGGSGRDVLLPPEEEGLTFFILNAEDVSGDLTVKEDSDTTTIDVLPPGRMMQFTCANGTWRAAMSPNGMEGVAALTENSGAVGGTNDGDMPDIGTVGASYVQAEVVAIRDAVREVAAKLNAMLTAGKA